MGKGKGERKRDKSQLKTSHNSNSPLSLAYQNFFGFLLSFGFGQL